MSIESKIKTTVKEFIADLRRSVFKKKDDKEDLMAMENFFDELSPVQIATKMVKYILPYTSQIEKKDDRFFIDNKDKIFEGLDKKKIDYAADIITKKPDQGGLDNENKEIIWSYFKTLLKLTQLYKKRV